MITTTKDLKTFIARVSKSKFITVDTEFVREKTYWSQLCLIQVANLKESAMIDPMAQGIDLSSFFELMSNHNVLKVFHAARQDIEIFVHLANCIPTPFMDTQVAAMMLGFGDQIGYDSLISKTLGIPIDKSSRFTNWSLRPLTHAQKDYALGDVIHLAKAWPLMEAKLKQRNRLDWLYQELQPLTDPSFYSISPNEAWKKLKPKTTSPLFFHLMKELAEFREMHAQKKNLPKNWILRDDTLLNIASSRPTTMENLSKVRSINIKQIGPATAHKIISIVNDVINLPKESLEKPSLVPRHKSTGVELDLLKVLLKVVAHKQTLAPKAIANNKQLEDLLMDPKAPSPLLEGWRKNIFGNQALDLIDGKISLSVQNKSIELKYKD